MLKVRGKKVNFAFVITTMIVVLCIALSGCADTTQDYYDLDTTYAMAQELGYTGTLDEFITLISGKDGVDGRGIVDFELASSNGGIDTYVISFSDGTTHSFTVKNGVDGASAAQGDSAYEVWESLPENQGKSVTDFIDAISGADGENGASATAVEAATNYAIGSTASVIANFNRSGYSSTSSGSAIIYKDDADTNTLYLLTNYHVVYNARLDDTSTDVKIYLYGMPYFAENGVMVGGIVAKYVGGTYTNDVAVLTLTGDAYLEYVEYKNKCGKISTDPDSEYLIRPVKEASSPAVAGDAAIAIGNPAGGGISVTSGVVSVASENISIDLSYDGSKTIDTRVIRIDTAINSGNSGGGLFTSDGAWIGIVNAKTSSNTIENIAYAIPHELASAVADNIIRGHEKQLSDGDLTNDDDIVSVQMPTIGIESKVQDRYATVINGKIVVVDQLVVNQIIVGENLAYALQQADSENQLKVGDVLVSAKLGGITYQLNHLYTLKELLYKIDQETDDLFITVLREDISTELQIIIDADDIHQVG